MQIIGYRNLDSVTLSSIDNPPYHRAERLEEDLELFEFSRVVQCADNGFDHLQFLKKMVMVLNAGSESRLQILNSGTGSPFRFQSLALSSELRSRFWLRVSNS